ncbi:MAG: NAD(P)/FAD-dependent oxidoreductase [Caldilineaceae bacterium]
MAQLSQDAPPLRVAIIGGGITGLTAAYDLTRNPQTRPIAVTIYEAGPTLGGLAAGFKGQPYWEWPLEYFYHHLFTNDDAILGLTKELGLGHLLQVHRPTTVIHQQGHNYPFDSPLRLLLFPKLGIHHRLRMGAVLAYLKYHPKPPWRDFDRLLADEWLAHWMGETGHDMIWRPMLQGKFGAHYTEVNLAWFWARIFKRTPNLIYYEGGFQALIDGLAKQLCTQGVTIQREQAVQAIRHQSDNTYTVATGQGERRDYDVVLSTVSPSLFQRIAVDLPQSYLQQLQGLKSMGAVVVTVALNQPLMEQIYWVNLPKGEGFPFLALVEHTNMISPTHYGGDHLLYLGDYLDPDHRYFAMDLEALLAEFTPHLRKFNPNFNQSWITGAWVHKAKYAQPVPPVGYLQMIPDLRTPLPGLYFASMSQVYPWDRGTNYAVELGRRVAKLMQSDLAA